MRRQPVTYRYGAFAWASEQNSASLHRYRKHGGRRFGILSTHQQLGGRKSSYSIALMCNRYALCMYGSWAPKAHISSAGERNLAKTPTHPAQLSGGVGGRSGRQICVLRAREGSVLVENAKVLRYLKYPCKRRSRCSDTVNADEKEAAGGALNGRTVRADQAKH